MVESLLQRAHHSPQIAWGDIPTWALFVGAFVAALIALRQLRVQQVDSARQTRQLERQQANRVDFTWTQARGVLTLPPLPGGSGARAVAIVSNDSSRPIRAVTSQIRLGEGGTLDPVKTGVVEKCTLTSAHDWRMLDPQEGVRIPLIRPGFSYGFVFDFTIPDDDAKHPERRTAHPFTRFTDDADLSWEIDDDLHLKPVRARRTPGEHIMGAPDPPPGP